MLSRSAQTEDGAISAVRLSAAINASGEHAEAFLPIAMLSLRIAAFGSP